MNSAYCLMAARLFSKLLTGISVSPAYQDALQFFRIAMAYGCRKVG